MKILIVDDSTLIQDRLKKTLSEVSDEVNITQAYTCKEALERFSPLKPDYVILDISLPDGSGIDLLRFFKKENPMSYIIIYTNYPTAEFKKNCMDLGSDYFFNKTSIHKLKNLIK